MKAPVVVSWIDSGYADSSWIEAKSRLNKMHCIPPRGALVTENLVTGFIFRRENYVFLVCFIYLNLFFMFSYFCLFFLSFLFLYFFLSSFFFTLLLFLFFLFLFLSQRTNSPSSSSSREGTAPRKCSRCV